MSVRPTGEADSVSTRLRLVVFTAGPPAPVNRVSFERLARDPLVDLRAIVVDEYVKPRRPWALRLVRGFRREGWPWLWLKLCSAIVSLDDAGGRPRGRPA